MKVLAAVKMQKSAIVHHDSEGSEDGKEWNKKYDDVLFSTAVSQRMKNCPITRGQNESSVSTHPLSFVLKSCR